MKFTVLAVDFDGTIARGDVLDGEVRQALGELRAQGIAIVLATGRILEDLHRVAGELHFADAVVAENGATIYFPDSGYQRVLGSAPPPALLDALRGEGIAVDVGRVVVEASASDATRILRVIRQLELPLALAFNRGRLMILPQTISKATGVAQALGILRLSPHNAVAIGDAENDHELLRLCEVGVAVAWGSDALKRAADFVLPGEGPAAVAPWIRALANRQRVPAPLHTRRQLQLGHTDDGAPLSLAVRGRNMLVAGDPKSGKSWVAGLLIEQLILQGYCLCVLDPEGDYASLEALPGVRVLGGDDPLPAPRELVRALRHADTSVIVDLSHASHADKVVYMRSALSTLAALRRRTGLPHRIVVDEAHYFLHAPDAAGLLDLDLNGYTVVSYRASQLNRALLDATQAVIVTCESDPVEVQALVDLCRTCTGRRSEDEWRQLFGGLAIGDAVVLPVTEEAGGEPRRVHLGPRLTPHVRHLAKYIDVPVPDARAFVFWQDGQPTSRRASTLREFVEALETMTSDAALDGHLRRGDFSRWVAGVFGDFPLAAEVQQLEVQYAAGRLSEIAPRLAQIIRARYEFLDGRG